MPSIVDLLLEAAESKSTATIVYNGGSKPGLSRPVIPLNVIGGSLFAREPGLPTEKTFKTAKIARVELQDGRCAEHFGVQPIQTFSTPILDSLAEYIALLKADYSAQGWNVFEQPQLFGVGLFLKNGTPRKNPIISIQFMDRSEVEVLDFETGEVVVEKRQLTGRERPWRVESKRQPQAKAFSELHTAMEFFAAEVAASSPKG